MSKNISVARAILVGQLVVNLPVVVIMLMISGLGIFIVNLFFTALQLSGDWLNLLGLLTPVIIGITAGWLWWSFSVPRWRKWALQNGAPESELQKWAVITGLVWRKGSIFEKTEFRLKE
jgi:hypothetical protein